MLSANKDQTTLSLRPGPNWSSFEKFRKEGATALDSIKNGTVASLQTKSGQYRILSERDYQKLYGLARDVDRLQGGLRVVVSAVERSPCSIPSCSLTGRAPLEVFLFRK